MVKKIISRFLLVLTFYINFGAAAAVSACLPVELFLTIFVNFVVITGGYWFLSRISLAWKFLLVYRTTIKKEYDASLFNLKGTLQILIWCVDFFQYFFSQKNEVLSILEFRVSFKQFCVISNIKFICTFLYLQCYVIFQIAKL